VNRVHTVLALAVVCAIALAEPSYTGYSGAPGTSGSCASTCHGTTSGRVTVAGFPATYEVGQSYVIRVSTHGGGTISNFNASVRVGTGSQTAGTITAGYMTATYSTGNEPNGVHLSSNNQDSCNFNWQAPAGGVGDVKLYLAAHQGSMGGGNTDVVLTAAQSTGISQDRTLPPGGFGLRVEPTVSAGSVCFRTTVPPGNAAVLRVTDRSGRVLERITLSGSAAMERALIWSPVDSRGRRLARGTYFVTLASHGRRLTGKFAIR
jgi:hypothetical protein